MSNEETNQRWKEICALLPGLQDCPICYAFAKTYAMGVTITKEECLAQIIRALKQSNVDLKAQLIKRAKQYIPACIIKP